MLGQNRRVCSLLGKVKVQKNTHQRKKKGKTVRHGDLVDHLLLVGHDLLQDHLVNHLLDRPRPNKLKPILNQKYYPI